MFTVLDRDATALVEKREDVVVFVAVRRGEGAEAVRGMRRAWSGMQGVAEM